MVYLLIVTNRTYCKLIHNNYESCYQLYVIPFKENTHYSYPCLDGCYDFASTFYDRYVYPKLFPKKIYSAISSNVYSILTHAKALQKLF